MNRILVLGGAKPGIGQAVTRRLLADGHSVVVTYEPEAATAAEALVEQAGPALRAHAVDPADVGGLDARLLGADRLHGIVDAEFDFYMESRDTFDLRKWERSLAVNLTLPKWIGHHAVNTWASTSVVFITSSEASSGSFGAHAYAATKAAVHNLTKSLANVAAGQCRFNSVAAGWIGGVMDTDDVFEMSRTVTPLGRLGSPDEVADTAVWLLGQESTFVNGATIVVDGGYTGVDTISKHEYEHDHGPLTAPRTSVP